MRYKVALAQMDTGGDVANNLSKIEAFAKEAAARGAQLVVFPERAEYMGANLWEQAQPVPGDHSRWLSDLARRLQIFILCGVNESNDSDQSCGVNEANDSSNSCGVSEAAPPANPYNTSLLLGPEGRLLAKYRKIHLFQVEGETISVDEGRFTSAGRDVVVADTPLGKVGMSICYDLRFPELYRKMALEGAEVLTLPADFTYETGKDHWRTLLCARAIENSCYVLAANQCGRKPKYRAYGHSMIIDPWGRVLAEAGEQEGIIFGEIDSEVIAKVRRQMPSLQNIRKDIF